MDVKYAISRIAGLMNPHIARSVLFCYTIPIPPIEEHGGLH